VNVIAHQVELVMSSLFCWMGGQLGWRQGKISHPPPASTDERPSASRKKERTASASLLKMIA
jgi:hypothetical protein